MAPVRPSAASATKDRKKKSTERCQGTSPGGGHGQDLGMPQPSRCGDCVAPLLRRGAGAPWALRRDFTASADSAPGAGRREDASHLKLTCKGLPKRKNKRKCGIHLKGMISDNKSK